MAAVDHGYAPYAGDVAAVVAPHPAEVWDETYGGYGHERDLHSYEGHHRLGEHHSYVTHHEHEDHHNLHYEPYKEPEQLTLTHHTEIHADHHVAHHEPVVVHHDTETIHHADGETVTKTTAVHESHHGTTEHEVTTTKHSNESNEGQQSDYLVATPVHYAAPVHHTTVVPVTHTTVVPAHYATPIHHYDNGGTTGFLQ